MVKGPPSSLLAPEHGRPCEGHWDEGLWHPSPGVRRVRHRAPGSLGSRKDWVGFDQEAPRTTYPGPQPVPGDWASCVPFSPSPQAWTPHPYPQSPALSPHPRVKACDLSLPLRAGVCPAPQLRPRLPAHSAGLGYHHCHRRGSRPAGPARPPRWARPQPGPRRRGRACRRGRPWAASGYALGPAGSRAT